MEKKKMHYMLEIDILRKFLTLKKLGVLRGGF